MISFYRQDGKGNLARDTFIIRLLPGYFHENVLLISSSPSMSIWLVSLHVDTKKHSRYDRSTSTIPDFVQFWMRVFNSCTHIVYRNASGKHDNVIGSYYIYICLKRAYFRVIFLYANNQDCHRLTQTALTWTSKVFRKKCLPLFISLMKWLILK